MPSLRTHCSALAIGTLCTILGATGCASSFAGDVPSGYPSQPTAGAGAGAGPTTAAAQRQDDVGRAEARDSSDRAAGAGFHQPGFEPKLLIRDVAPREPRHVDFVVCAQCARR